MVYSPWMFFVMDSSVSLIPTQLYRNVMRAEVGVLGLAAGRKVSLLRKKVASLGRNHDLGLWTLLCVEHRISRTGGFDLCPYPALLSGREFL